jgi:hypothetical protein
MALSVRLLTSVSVENRDRFAALASARGVSVSRLLARLVHHAVAELHTSEPRGIAPLAPTGSAAAKKYTVRLWGAEAACPNVEQNCVTRLLRATSRTYYVRICGPSRPCLTPSFKH